MARHNQVGAEGEKVAATFLERKGFTILDRNYRKKWGELDIVAIKDKVVHIVEVKTVSWHSFQRPEENMHYYKIQRLKRAIQTYFLEKYKKGMPEWQFDLVCVYLNIDTHLAKVKFMENLIL